MTARVFVPDDQLEGGRGVVLGQDASHLVRSLRSRIGERVVLVDSKAVEHEVVLDLLAADRAGGRVVATRPAAGEPRLQVDVLQALPKDGMDGVVDGLAALGASGIWPCISERTIARPEPSRRARRVDHWQRIAREAAQLAGRGRMPTVHPILSLDEACRQLTGDARILACVVSSDTVPLNRIDLDPAVPVALMIGPEGDLSSGDLAALEGRRYEAVHLGPRVLRSRLAAATALTLLLARSGDLDRPVVGWEAVP